MTDDLGSTPVPRTLLVVTGDLFLLSRIAGLAERSGCRAVPVRNLDEANARAADRVLIDLAAPGIDVSSLAVTLGPDLVARSAAYAPHVRVDLLKAARSAGLAAVFTRSQLDSELPRWLAE